MSQEQKASDFRYDTGAARVPWAAVGEALNLEDIGQILQFLLPPREDRKQDYDAAFRQVMEQLAGVKDCSSYAGKLTLGGQVAALEEQARQFLAVEHAIFLTNATAGFEIAYKYAGLGPGDEVIAPAITFIATILYPLAVGAKVVLADVDPVTLNMDPADLARKITDRTRVIIPVHLGGYPVDMDPIMELARERDIVVIEDAAHAFGALYNGRKTGTIGHFGAFSFHEVKNITALGEGGLLVSNLDFGRKFPQARFVGLDLADPIPTWLYNVHALQGKRGLFAGANHSATEIQALALQLQLKRLDGIIERRRQCAEYLNQRFAGIPAIIPQRLDTERIKSTHHLYLLQIDPARLRGDIQQFKARLTDKGVVQIPHFAPLYKFSLMRELGYDTAAIERSCPVAEEAFRHRFTHLPLYPLSDEQLAYMADAVIEVVHEMQAD